MSTAHTATPAKKPLLGVRQCDCGGRSFMNGFCLTCQHKEANGIANGDELILASCLHSLNVGFAKAGAK